MKHTLKIFLFSLVFISPALSFAQYGYDTTLVEHMPTGYGAEYTYTSNTMHYPNGVTINSAFGDEPLRSTSTSRNIRRVVPSYSKTVASISEPQYSDFSEIQNAPQNAFSKNSYGASALSSGFSFLPQTAIGWVGLLILSLFFVFLLRYIVQTFKA